MWVYNWDDNKRESNLIKHGIDFVDAVGIFLDKERVEKSVIRNGEIRYLTVGNVEGRILCVIYVVRAPYRRIISARKANRTERKDYEEGSG